jgi:hypothetical protein
LGFVATISFAPVLDFGASVSIFIRGLWFRPPAWWPDSIFLLVSLVFISWALVILLPASKVPSCSYFIPVAASGRGPRHHNRWIWFIRLHF